MKVLQSRSFAKKVKKLNKKEKSQIDDQIKFIIENPNIGIEKKGDLKGIFVHKVNYPPLKRRASEIKLH